ncbi:hypothetical protein HUU40_13050 [candidate division KSB1 bacterium]|nr:hypothetical protein [candidate division KSB1 bacterium]
MDANKCLLCGSSELEYNKDGHDWEYSCVTCRHVRISSRAKQVLADKYKDKLWLLSAFCRKRTDSQLPPVTIYYDNIEKIVESMKTPASVTEALNRLILYFGKNSKLCGNWIPYDRNTFLDVVIELEEMPFLLRLLREQGYLVLRASDAVKEDKADSETIESSLRRRQDEYAIRLSGEGWKKYESLISSNEDSDKVFVAMWYSDKTKRVREAIKAGIEAAGYDPIIADEGDFTGNIMDFVLGSIRQSKFIVADFTVEPEKIEQVENIDPEKPNHRLKGGVRGGVYYEAGFAKGLGLEVIHTCCNDVDSKDRLHFDVKHENTIFWTDEEVEETYVRTLNERQKNGMPSNLSEKLHDRIVAIFGRGPIVLQKTK